jgi:hypothetical protein
MERQICDNCAESPTLRYECDWEDNYRFIFILLQPLPGCSKTKSGSVRFQRTGLGAMERAFWAGVDDVEALDFVSKATSDDLDVKRSTWAPYIQQIELE